MKKIIVLFLLLVVFSTGCSYKIVTRNNQAFHGESENWEADYNIIFTTTYPTKDDKSYVERTEETEIMVTCKNDLSYLAAAKHIEMSYEDGFGNGGTLTEDYDSHSRKKQFRLGGGSSSTTAELGDYLMKPEYRQHSILVFAGPSHDIETKAAVVITVQIYGKTETIRLSPVDTSPESIFFSQLNDELKRIRYSMLYPDYFKNLDSEIY